MTVVFGFPSLVRLSHSFLDPRNSRPCHRLSMQRSLLSSENLVVMMLLLVVIFDIFKLIFSLAFGECHLNLTMIDISLPLPNSSYSTKLHGNHELEDNKVKKVGMKRASCRGAILSKFGDYFSYRGQVLIANLW